MFPIMTDAEIEAADEMTLRARVRELSTAISQLADIAHQMREQNTLLRGIHVTTHQLASHQGVVVLRDISRDMKTLLTWAHATISAKKRVSAKNKRKAKNKAKKHK